MSEDESRHDSLISQPQTKGYLRQELQQKVVELASGSKSKKKREILSFLVSGCTSATLGEVIRRWGGD